jgi:hypothetical protein
MTRARLDASAAAPAHRFTPADRYHAVMRILARVLTVGMVVSAALGLLARTHLIG